MEARLEQQRRAYEERMRRIVAGEKKLAEVPVRVYTARERYLIGLVIKRLRQRRSISMAETVLANAVLLKEANVISRELQKSVVYQYCVVEGPPFVRPRSFWESSSSDVLGQTADEEDEALTAAAKPCIGVQVLDKRHGSAYTWSLDRLKQRVQRMRSLYNYIDRPLLAKHLNHDEPFYELPGPQFTFIGSARMHMRNLVAMIPQQCDVPLICRRTGRTLAKLQMGLLPIKQTVVAPVNGTTTTEESDNQKNEVIPTKLQQGAKLLLEIQITQLTGLSERDFTQVHCQFRLSSFGVVGAGSSGDRVYATELVSDFGDDEPVYFGYTQTISLPVTPAVLHQLRHGSLVIEVFGRVKSWLLSAWGRGEEASKQGRDASTQSATNGAPVERRSDEELVTEERHDVLAWIQVLELGPTGAYEPTVLIAQNAQDQGVFALRQGLQRRVSLTLTHSSGRQFQWTRVTGITISRLRMQDPRGHISEGYDSLDVKLSMLPGQKVEYNLDGTSTLIAEAAWDSSLHNSIFVNRPTPANHRVIASLIFTIEAQRCTEPILFETDIYLQIGDRQSQRSSRTVGFRSLLGNAPKILDKFSQLFQVVLTPPITKNLAELWRANTASTYVRGEEFLDGWRPRGVSMVNEYRRTAERIRRIESTEDTRQYLALRDLLGVPLADVTPRADDSANELCDKFARLWKKYPYVDDQEMMFTEEPPVPGVEQNTDAPPKPEVKEQVKLTPKVTAMTKSNTVSKKGFLYFPDTDIANAWLKRYFVIRRPYMYMYNSKNETEELGIINLSMVRVSHSEELDRMLNVSTLLSAIIYIILISQFRNNLCLHSIPKTMHTCYKQVVVKKWKTGFDKSILGIMYCPNEQV
jgi:kinesin family protein 1